MLEYATNARYHHEYPLLPIRVAIRRFSICAGSSAILSIGGAAWPLVLRYAASTTPLAGTARRRRPIAVPDPTSPPIRASHRRRSPPGRCPLLHSAAGGRRGDQQQAGRLALGGGRDHRARLHEFCHDVAAGAGLDELRREHVAGTAYARRGRNRSERQGATLGGL